MAPLPPLLHLIATRPQLLADHAQAYAELLTEVLGKVSIGWQRCALLNALALCAAGVAAVLAGVALMLWAIIPAAQIQAPWALIAAPLLPVAIALGCLNAARAPGGGDAFEMLRRQVKADLLMLRELNPP